MFQSFKKVLLQPNIALRTQTLLQPETARATSSIHPRPQLNRLYTNSTFSSSSVLLELKQRHTLKFQPHAPKPCLARQNFGRWSLLEADLFHLKIVSLKLPLDKIRNDHIYNIATEMKTRDYNQCKRYFTYHYMRK